MGRKPTPITDAGIIEIETWCAEFLRARRQVIAENVDMTDTERAMALAAAESETNAIGERMKSEYQTRQRTAPR